MTVYCCPRTPLPLRAQLPLLKDGNMFLSFHVDDELVHRNFLAMVAADAAFLTRTNIMDYSLLLGIAFHTPRTQGRRVNPNGPPLPEGFGAAQSKSSSWCHRLDCWAGIEVCVADVVRSQTHKRTSAHAPSQNARQRANARHRLHTQHARKRPCVVLHVATNVFPPEPAIDCVWC